MANLLVDLTSHKLPLVGRKFIRLRHRIVCVCLHELWNITQTAEDVILLYSKYLLLRLIECGSVFIVFIKLDCVLNVSK